MNLELLAHVGFGELSAGLYLLVLGVLAGGVDERSLSRARKLSLLAWVALALAWVLGTHYYLTQYAAVSPVIVDGPDPWGHQVAGAVKKSAFLFLPVLGALHAGLLHRHGVAEMRSVAIDLDSGIADGLRSATPRPWWAVVSLSVVLVVTIAGMAGLGALVSAAFRAATSPVASLTITEAIGTGAAVPIDALLGVGA